MYHMTSHVSCLFLTGRFEGSNLDRCLSDCCDVRRATGCHRGGSAADRRSVWGLEESQGGKPHLYSWVSPHFSFFWKNIFFYSFLKWESVLPMLCQAVTWFTEKAIFFWFHVDYNPLGGVQKSLLIAEDRKYESMLSVLLYYQWVVYIFLFLHSYM